MAAVTLDESLLRVSDKTSNNYERVPALKKHSHADYPIIFKSL